MNIHESGENYIETIYMLHKEGRSVKAVDVANALGYSKASVSRALGILRRAELIIVDGISGVIGFTPKGLEHAQNIYERHLNITDFLVEALGISKELAEKDACRIEHIISQEAYEGIKTYLKKRS